MQAASRPLAWKSCTAPGTASMPPAASRLVIQVARTVKSAGVPSVARNTCGRLAVATRWASEASRNASKPSARRCWASGSHSTMSACQGVPMDQPSGSAMSSIFDGASFRLGYSDTPVSADLAPGDVLVAGSARFGDQGLRLASGKKGHHAACLLDLLKQLPRRTGQLAGQVFHIPGTGSSIGDAASTRILPAGGSGCCAPAAGRTRPVAPRRR